MVERSVPAHLPSQARNKLRTGHSAPGAAFQIMSGPLCSDDHRGAALWRWKSTPISTIWQASRW